MKQWQKLLLQERAAQAVKDMYHNATPYYPDVDEEDLSMFKIWFDGEVTNALDEINHPPYRQIPEPTLFSDDSGESRELQVRVRYKQYYADRYYRLHPWMKIRNYGVVQLLGRGGRTAAPDGLIRNLYNGMGLFIPNLRQWSIEELTDLANTVEYFNEYVVQWCDEVDERWYAFKTGVDEQWKK